MPVVPAWAVARVPVSSDTEAAFLAGAALNTLDNLVRLQQAGLYKTALSYDHIDRVAFTLQLRDARARRVVPSTGSAPPSNVRKARWSPGITSSAPTSPNPSSGG